MFHLLTLCSLCSSNFPLKGLEVLTFRFMLCNTGEALKRLPCASTCRLDHGCHTTAAAVLLKDKRMFAIRITSFAFHACSRHVCVQLYIYVILHIVILYIYKWSSNHKSQRATRSPWCSSWLPMTSVASKERSLSQDKTDDITVIIVT